MKKRILYILPLLSLILPLPLLADYYSEGCHYYISKNYEKAKEKLLQAVEASNGENGDAYYFLGEIDKSTNNFESSENFFKSAVEAKRITPKYYNLAYWNLIVLAEQRGAYFDMVKYCRDLWKTTKDEGAKNKVENIINKMMWSSNEEAKNAYQSGQDALSRKDADAAIKHFTSAIDKDPQFLAPHLELGMIAYKNGNNNLALQHLTPIADKIPFYSEIHLLLGNIYFNNKSYRDAVDHLTLAADYGFLDKETLLTIKLKKATANYHQGYYDKAQEDITAILNDNPRNMTALLLQSSIQIGQNKYDQAIKTLDTASKIAPKNTEILYQLGSICYKQNNKAYITHFKKLYDLTLENKGSVPDKYYKGFQLLLGYYREVKSYNEYLALYKILPANYTDEQSNKWAAIAAFNQKDYILTIQLLQKYHLTNEESIILAKTYAANNMLNEAKAYMKNHPEIIEQLLNDPILGTTAYELKKELHRNTTPVQTQPVNPQINKPVNTVPQVTPTPKPEPKIEPNNTDGSVTPTQPDNSSENITPENNNANEPAVQ